MCGGWRALSRSMYRWHIYRYPDLTWAVLTGCHDWRSSYLP
jgi:hypothetical protein